MCELYESKDGGHPDMPTIDCVVDFMNDRIHNINEFFHELHNSKNRKRNDDEKYVSVCTGRETSRGRCFVSSNGLR